MYFIVFETERRCRVVSTSVSYSGGAGFKFFTRRLATQTKVFRGFPQFFQGNAWILPSQSLSFKLFPTHNLLITLLFDGSH
jgi:hypothetical protein